MKKVLVYNCKSYDALTDQIIISSSKRTAQAIKLLAGPTIILETEEEVDASLINEEGQYIPAIHHDFDNPA